MSGVNVFGKSLVYKKTLSFGGQFVGKERGICCDR